MVKRKHRRIVDLGLTLLIHASLPLKVWDYAFLTTIYLINRLPTASLHNVIPYTVLFKQTPDYNFIKVFGCACFPLLRPYNTHKFDFRSHKCLFLGYFTSHKGYKCLSPSGMLFISKDVLFNESRFPYNDIFVSNSESSQSLSKVFISVPPFPAVSVSPIALILVSTPFSSMVSTNPINISSPL